MFPNFQSSKKTSNLPAALFFCSSSKVSGRQRAVFRKSPFYTHAFSRKRIAAGPCTSQLNSSPWSPIRAGQRGGRPKPKLVVRLCAHIGGLHPEHVCRAILVSDMRRAIAPCSGPGKKKNPPPLFSPSHPSRFAEAGETGSGASATPTVGPTTSCTLILKRILTQCNSRSNFQGHLRRCAFHNC